MKVQNKAGRQRVEVAEILLHVLVRLYLGDVEKLGEAARAAIEETDLVASPAAVLELEFLHEIGSQQPTASKIITTLSEEIGLTVCELPFRTVVQHALRQKWGRYPLDRLIVATPRRAVHRW